VCGASLDGNVLLKPPPFRLSIEGKFDGAAFDTSGCFLPEQLPLVIFVASN